MITKKIKHKDSTGVVHEYDIGADAKNISEDTTHQCYRSQVDRTLLIAFAKHYCIASQKVDV